MIHTSMMSESKMSKIYNSPHTTKFSQTPLLEPKVIESRQLNDKLQKLFHSLKSNTHMKTLSHSSSSSLLSNKQKFDDKKQQQKMEMQVQHMKHLENILLCETRKLKEEVNNRRKQRVIYSNIFKKYQKDIKKWQCQYKQLLLDSMATTDAQNSLREKIQKTRCRLEKEIKQLETIKQEIQQETKMNSHSTNHEKGQQKQLSSRKNTLNNESYKRLVSQKQLELKAKSLESEFQKESRKIMYEALSEQVLKIAGTDSLHEAIILIKNIDNKTEEIYEMYELLEKQNKQKESKCHELQQKIKEKEGTVTQIPTQKQILQFNTISEQIDQEEQRMRKMQEELSLKLDVNCRKLSTDQLMSFIDRIMLTRNNEAIKKEHIQQQEYTERRKSVKIDNMLSVKEVHKLPRRPRNMLEKRLQKVEKEKQINDYLLTYTEISKFMLDQCSHK